MFSLAVVKGKLAGDFFGLNCFGKKNPPELGINHKIFLILFLILQDIQIYGISHIWRIHSVFVPSENRESAPIHCILGKSAEFHSVDLAMAHSANMFKDLGQFFVIWKLFVASFHVYGLETQFYSAFFGLVHSFLRRFRQRSLIKSRKIFPSKACCTPEGTLLKKRSMDK
jgi:hypothetical protein